MFENTFLVQLTADFLKERAFEKSIELPCESKRLSRLVDRCCLAVSDLDELFCKEEFGIRKSVTRKELGLIQLPYQKEQKTKFDDHFHFLNVLTLQSKKAILLLEICSSSRLGSEEISRNLQTYQTVKLNQ